MSLNNELHECKKSNHDDIREKDRKINEEKLVLNKKISALEAQFQEKSSEKSSLNHEFVNVQN